MQVKSTARGELRTLEGDVAHVCIRYMLDSRRDLHERHAETYGTLEKLEKAYKELQGKVTPPKWLTYEPPGIVVSSPKVPKNEPLEAEAVPAESATADPIDDPNLLADAFGVMTVRDETKTQYHGWNAVAEVRGPYYPRLSNLGFSSVHPQGT